MCRILVPHVPLCHVAQCRAPARGLGVCRVFSLDADRQLRPGQKFVDPSSASSLNTYSPSSSVVHEKVKLTPVLPTGTLALAGLGLPHV